MSNYETLKSLITVMIKPFEVELNISIFYITSKININASQFCFVKLILNDFPILMNFYFSSVIITDNPP